MSETESANSGDASLQDSGLAVSQQLEAIKSNHWKPSFDTLYDSYFQELLASAVSDRWQRIDIATNLLVAFTASGSAIAGWALWNEIGWRTVWLIVAGVASMSSIVHGVLSVPTRIKDQEDLRQQFSRLRVDIQTFRQNLQIIIAKSEQILTAYEEINRDYNELRKRYADYVMRARRDIANTAKLRVKIQEEVNKLLEGEMKGGTHAK